MTSRCADLSRTLGEPMDGTAPKAQGWVLVQQAGAWGRKALTDSGLDAQIGEELARRAAALDLKALLVKPAGRHPSSGPSVLLASSVPGASFLEELVVDDAAELVELDLARLAAGRPSGAGRICAEPLYLVCTNGKRDPCCSRLGLPVARALAAARPGRVWQCSHIGGHRFAANVVCLPDGLCYGRVAPDRAVELAEAHEDGRVVTDLLRGRSALSPEAQAAECLLRGRGLLSERAAIVGAAATGGRISLETSDGRRILVDVATVAGPFRPPSCGEEPEPSERFELVRVAE